MAPVFNGNFEDLYSEPVQYRRDGFTYAEDRAQAAHIHKQVAHTPALHPAGITGIWDFYSHYTVMCVILLLFSRVNMYENSSLFQNWMQIEFEIQMLIILQIIMFCK